LCFALLPAARANESSAFDAGKFVMEHVSDAHEWHLFTVGDVHVSIPLPVILYSKTGGFHVFLSSRFEHGHAVWQNFRIAQEGSPHAGKIVELDASGTELAALPWDFSITKTVAGLIFSAIIIILLFTWLARRMQQIAGHAPSGLLNMLEPVILFVRDDVAKSSIGEHYERFMPFLLSVFFFILINNLFGLIPIAPFGANVTGNIGVTLVLALFTFFVTSFSGNRHYWKEIFNPDVPVWMKFPLFPLMQLIEIMSMFIKPIVLMVRLFANMLAGHMVITVFLSLIFMFSALLGPVASYGVSVLSVIFSVFITLLDVLVSFIQAYVFTLLSALYIGMATSGEH
jgi:F-type H+-transporting ATPase subunit a